MNILAFLLLFLGAFAQDSEETLRNKHLSIIKTKDALITGELGSLTGQVYSVCYGEACRSVDQFLGIPYAKLPARFAKPEKYDRLYHGSFYTKKAACWQYVARGGFEDHNSAAKIWLPDHLSENCLNLNVWSPHNYDNRHNLVPTGDTYPVMVWIFGGGFSSGSATLDVYDGKVLSAVEQVTVASMEYRVGAFGYLYIQNKTTGNMGLYDQQLALEWIKENIHFFQGDRKRITIFGESAGAASVGFHYLNEKSRKYFNNAIMMSASPFSRWALSSIKQAADVGEAVIFFHEILFYSYADIIFKY